MDITSYYIGFCTCYSITSFFSHSVIHSERVSMSFTYNIIVFHVALPHAFQKARDVLSVNSRVFRGFSESWKVSGRAGSTDITAVLQR